MLRARELLRQRRDSKKKIYSIHAPEVECIGKGKAHKHYEFGCKVSVVATSREGFVIGMRALHGSPYDGHTLAGVMEQAQRLAGQELNGDVFTDLGYREHNYEGPARVHVGNRTKEPNAALRKWKKRRAAVEPLIGHMKNDGRLGRNHLLGRLDDQINAIMSACGQNLRLMLGLLARSSGAKGGRKAFAHLLALVMWALREALRLAPNSGGRNLCRSTDESPEERLFQGRLCYPSACSYFRRAKTTTPIPIKRMPVHSRIDGRSRRKITAKMATRSRLSLSIEATLDASPIFRARK